MHAREILKRRELFSLCVFLKSHWTCSCSTPHRSTARALSIWEAGTRHPRARATRDTAQHDTDTHQQAERSPRPTNVKEKGARTPKAGWRQKRARAPCDAALKGSNQRGAPRERANRQTRLCSCAAKQKVWGAPLPSACAAAAAPTCQCARVAPTVSVVSAASS